MHAKNKTVLLPESRVIFFRLVNGRVYLSREFFRSSAKWTGKFPETYVVDDHQIYIALRGGFPGGSALMSSGLSSGDFAMALNGGRSQSTRL